VVENLKMVLKYVHEYMPAESELNLKIPSFGHLIV